MAHLNYDVLVGGFHCVKDDELQIFSDTQHFSRHVKAMLTVRDDAMNKTGERKAYIASLICDADDLSERWNIALELGVDGVLIARFIQGFSALTKLARQKELPILAHNTCSELLTRNPDWGIHERVWTHWLRHCGADWLVTNGGFGQHLLSNAFEQEVLCAMLEPLENEFSAVMPILQGGKRPEELTQYRDCCGQVNFMLIAANWLDNHPQGLLYAANYFRNAVSALEN